MLLAALAVVVIGAPADSESFPKIKIGALDQKLKPLTSERKRMPDSPNEAAAFWYGARVSENGKWPHDAVIVAKEQRDRLLQTDGGGVSAK